MKKSLRLLIFSILLVGMVSSACSPPSTPTSPPDVVVTQAAEVYPAPTEPIASTGTEAGYPSPAVVELVNPYPGPGQTAGVFAEWSQAETALFGGQVAEVFQASTQHVTLVLKDGSIVLVLEPALDDVFKVIERCGDACKDIVQHNP